MNPAVPPKLLLISILIVGALAGCLAAEPAPAAGSASSPTQVQTAFTDSASTPSDLSTLDPVLEALIQADNRTRYAESHGLVIEHDRVRVIIELESNASVPDGYEMAIELSVATDTGTEVQALVAVSDLEPLAAEGVVVEVRPPQTPVEQGP